MLITELKSREALAPLVEGKRSSSSTAKAVRKFIFLERKRLSSRRSLSVRDA